ncbi:hypothetical protein D082_22450 [Synechocystis sp. PCC 6714]|nr:hypothetical protein D082_22450 [Synechocystis sp. PCC 6714]
MVSARQTVAITPQISRLHSPRVRLTVLFLAIIYNNFQKTVKFQTNSAFG